MPPLRDPARASTCDPTPDRDRPTHVTRTPSAIGGGGPDAVALLVRDIQALAHEYNALIRRSWRRLALRPSELEALTVVAFATEPVTPTRLAADLNLTTSAVTDLLDRMASAGLLERRPHPQDRRSVHIGLAPTGARLAAEIVAVQEAAVRRVLGSSWCCTDGGARSLLARLGSALRATTAPADPAGVSLAGTR